MPHSISMDQYTPNRSVVRTRAFELRGTCSESWTVALASAHQVRGHGHRRSPERETALVLVAVPAIAGDAGPICAPRRLKLDLGVVLEARRARAARRDAEPARA